MGKKDKQVKTVVEESTPKHTPSGYVDLLDEDRAIAGQKFVCLSFISPENIIKQKNHFLFEKFLEYFDFVKSMSKFEQFMAFLAYKHNMDMEALMKDFQEFVKVEKEELKKTDVLNEYKGFLEKNEERLNEEFQDKFTFQTNTRGLKVRGVFPSQKEAELRSKMLRETDPHHDVYVGQVGVWMPWEPDAYRTGRVEYLQKELNDLMNEKNKNEEQAKRHFDERLLEARRRATEENVRKAKESGNKLTQTLDKDGNLVGIKSSNTTEQILGENEIVTMDQLKEQLFEGEEVRTKASDRLREEELRKAQEEADKIEEAGDEDEAEAGDEAERETD
jgi:hypothetical protein